MVANKQQKNSGGSALKRLKKSLQTAGVVGQTSKASRSKKDRKRGNPSEVGKNDVDKKLSLIRGEFNPFEQKTQKQKFEILGRKMKGVTGKPTLSKQIGEENRKKTLLVEMKNKNRQGGIIDKRFGENNPFITPEEKMLERFTRERQKTSKATMFNLDDDEDLSLTHYGQSLSNMDDFDDAGLALSDDENDGKQMDANIVSQMHFGGFDDDTPQEERHKSKNEIMKEIIAKSKMHKAERQLAKQEDDALREDLDEELNDIRGLLDTNKRKPLPSQTALFKRTEAENPTSQDLDDYSEYDKAVYELATDQRAQATDRTKTEEEIAIEAKEQLEKAERARKRRMEGLDSESEDESGYKKNRANKKRKGAPEGDDLEDDYLEELDEEIDRLGKGLTLEQLQNAFHDEESGEENEEEEEEEEESDDDDEEEEETDNEDIEDIEDDESIEFGGDDDDMNEFGATGKVEKKKNKKTSKEASTKEIPFTFECPSTHEEFLTILEGLSVEDVLVVSKRIRVLYHIKLAQENKNKLGQFIQVLVDHIGYLASTESELPTKVIEKLTLDVYELCQQLPEVAADIFTAKLKTMESELGKKIKYNGSSSWPAIEDMTTLRLIGQIFSTSDLNHSVATPSLLFMNQALSQCRVQSLNDMGRGLFLTLFTHEYQTVSKRILPESLNFLNKCLVLLSPESVFEEGIPGYFPVPTQVEFSIHESDGKSIDDIERIQFESFETEKPSEERFKFSLLQGVLLMIEKYIQLYASTPAFIELYSTTLTILEKMNELDWHLVIKEQLIKIINRLERQIKFSIEKRMKTPLLLQQHRPIPIAQHLPKFEKAYSMDRHYDPDHERSQQHKLESQLKKEKKGALRELRKDNQFIARERAKERKQKDDNYNKMLKGVMNLLEGEQSEQNRLDREKSKK